MRSGGVAPHIPNFTSWRLLSSSSPDCLALGERAFYIYRRLFCPQTRSGYFGGGKQLLYLPGKEPRFRSPFRSLDTLPTELLRLLIFKARFKNGLKIWLSKIQSRVEPHLWTDRRYRNIKRQTVRTNSPFENIEGSVFQFSATGHDPETVSSTSHARRLFP